MTGNITLTSSMRSNLSSLKSLASQMSVTQTRLSTGKKVNSAIDNANSYYQSRALTNRSSDLDMLLDAMGQSIQTITAASQGIESGLKMFEQMSSIAEEAAMAMSDDVKQIDSTMSTLQIQQILNQGGIISLKDDITLTQGLNIYTDGTTIVGNGHSITFTGTYGFSDPTIDGRLVNKIGESAINVYADVKISGLVINYSNIAAQGAAISIDGGKADIDNLTINGTTSVNRLYGIQVLNGGKLQLDSTKNIHLSGDYSEKIVNGNPNLWSGEYNTDMIVNQIGEHGLVAQAAKDFYAPGVALDDEEFGQGTWYLPSFGELCDVYGYDYSAMTTGGGASGALGNNRDTIKDTLKYLRLAGVEANEFVENYRYWSSSEGSDQRYSWGIMMSDGNRNDANKGALIYVRAFQLLEDKFADNATKPQIGDVMYSDLSYSDKNHIDTSKTAVGVVTWVSEDGASAKIVSLKDLTFSNQTSANNFEPDNPYNNSYDRVRWADSAAVTTNITAVNDYYFNDKRRLLSLAMNCRGEIAVSNTVVDPMDVSSVDYKEQFNAVRSAYDELINDAGYQGINLLNGNSIDVMFNETRTHKYTVQGKNADSGSLGVDASHWETLSDVKTSIAQLQSAVSTLRNISEALGNSLSIIQTRMDFTDAMTDILQTGADDLVLADMNEESANYLALQTRNNLAVNALALAAQSNNSVLKLF